MNYLINKYFNLNIWLVILGLILIYIISFNIEFNFIFTDTFYFDAFKNQERDKIISFMQRDKSIEWINYIYIPVIIFIPSFLISLCLYVGSFFFSDILLKYFNIFSITLKSQIIYAINYLFSVMLKWQKVLDRNLYNINNNYDFQSARLFFKNKDLPYWLIYPLQCINITEFIFILTLSFGIQLIIKTKFIKTLKFVIFCYGVGLIIWIVFTVLLQTLFYI